MDPIQDNKFAQLDFILCGPTGLSAMARIESIHRLALSSHHFILFCEMQTPFQLEKQKRQRSTPTKIQFDYMSLQKETIRRDLVHNFKMYQRKMSHPEILMKSY